VTQDEGTYQLKLRCSNGYRTQCVRSVYVNGVKCGTVSQDSTGGWETYKDCASISVPLKSGNNVIKICRDSTSQGGAIDIDYIECSK
jgi:hypothetical protein